MIHPQGPLRIVGVVLGDDVGVMGWVPLAQAEEAVAGGCELPWERVARLIDETRAKPQRIENRGPYG